MFEYTFNGKIYQAETIRELQELLVRDGFTGDVSIHFTKIADQLLQEEFEASQNNFDPIQNIHEEGQAADEANNDMRNIYVYDTNDKKS
jgi:hypothetical protein